MMKEKAKKLKRLIFKPREAEVIDPTFTLEDKFNMQSHQCPLFIALIEQQEEKKRAAPKMI